MASNNPPAPMSPVNRVYLILYNLASAFAWSIVLNHTAVVSFQIGPSFVVNILGEYTKWVQSFAALEILHSLFGLVRAPVMTTATQVASRLILVWVIVDPFPQIAQTPAYASMLAAWSLTEVIRYWYFALTLIGLQPRTLLWLRYTTFFLLYPIGIASECVMIWIAATGPAASLHPLLPIGLYGLLFAYAPLSVLLFNHMLIQRKRVLGAMAAHDANAAARKAQ